MPAAEVPALLWGIGASVATLSSFLIVKPLREAIGIAGGLSDLPWMFLGTWIVTLALIPLQLAVVARQQGARSFGALASACALVQLAFYAGLAVLESSWPLRVGFFLWVSVFNLFVVSALWSCFASAWRGASAVRSFGLLAAGGSAAAILCPWIAGRISLYTDPVALLAISAGCLLGATLCVQRMLAHTQRPSIHEPMRRGDADADGSSTEPVPLARSVGEGRTLPVPGSAVALPSPLHTTLQKVGVALALLVRSPLLRRTAIYAIAAATLATFFYAEQGRIVGAASQALGERTRRFANVDLVGNVLALGLQLLAASRLMAWAGVGATLTVMPAVAAVGAGVMLGTPTANTLAACEGARRGVTHGLARPARESLFAEIGGDARWGTKLVIDTLVVRSADAAAIWLHVGLVYATAPTAGLLAIFPIALATALVGWSLDRRRIAPADPARGG